MADDEYKPGSSEIAGDYMQGQSQGNINKLKLQKLLRIIVVFGSIVIAIIGGYKILNFYFDKKAIADEQIKEQAQTQASSSKQNKSMVLQQPILEKHVPSPSAQQNEALYREQTYRIDKFQDKLDESARKLALDSKQIADLNSSVLDIQQKISLIDSNISQLNDNIQKALSDIYILKTPKVQPKKQKKPLKPLVAYHVRAVVLGRAWLESADGKRLTVRVGDKIDGYGSVEYISPSQGMVLMSNGSVIQYGINDF